jgi:acyl-CoA thioester hydrolase
MPRLRFDLEISTFHIDFSGHVSNIVYIQWLEVARCRLFAAIGLPVAQLAQTHGIVPVLLETQIAYKRQLLMGDKPWIEVWICELGRASACMKFEVRHEGGELAAQAIQKGVLCSYPSMKPYKIPTELRTQFESYWESAPGN